MNRKNKMYYILHRFEEKKLKRKIQCGDHISPLADLNRRRENSPRFPQSFDQHGTPFCRYNDDLVGQIEFEIELKK